jgi:hypothetical protein
MATMKVKAYTVAYDGRERDVALDAATSKRIFTTMTFADWQRPENRDLARRWISTVCLAHNPKDDLLYCGLTAYDGDILAAFDVEKKTFRGLGFPSVGDRFDVKAHRSLEVDDDGTVYSATACLHDLEQRAEAAGGKIFSYDPALEKLAVLGVPVAHDYIQTIALDRKRKILYGFTYPVGHAFRFDIASRASRYLGLVQAPPHSPVIDDAGTLWGTWMPLGGAAARRCCFFSYDPGRDAIAWHRVPVPSLYPGDNGGVDSVTNGGDGFLYFGSSAGSLVRFDPRAVEARYLGHPLPSGRIAGLVVGRDGWLYGCGGVDYDTHLFRYDRAGGRFEVLGPLYDPARKTSVWHTHALCEPRPGLFYVGETDNMDRSGYLWECEVR